MPYEYPRLLTHIALLWQIFTWICSGVFHQCTDLYKQSRTKIKEILYPKHSNHGNSDNFQYSNNLAWLRKNWSHFNNTYNVHSFPSFPGLLKWAYNFKIAKHLPSSQKTPVKIWPAPFFHYNEFVNCAIYAKWLQ